MTANDLYPCHIPRDAFMPWGDEGEFFVVPGHIPVELFLDGCLAAQLEMIGWGEIADVLDAGPKILPWYDDDSDKPEDIYHAEIRAAWHKEHTASVSHTVARFWGEEHKDHPDNPYSDYDGGIELRTRYGDEWRFKSDSGDQQEGLPEIVTVTCFQEH